MKTLITGLVCLVVGGVISQMVFRSKPEIPLATASSGSELSATRRSAQEIEVPIIRLEDTPIEEALDYLRVRSRKNSGANSSSADDRLAFVLVDPNKTARRMDLSHQRVKMDKLCERIAELSGLNVAFEEDAIVFRAK
jgi:hypothetical protein